MPKKKKSKTKKKPSKKNKKKTRKKKSTKKTLRKNNLKKKYSNKTETRKGSSSELIFKTKQEWIKNSLANKIQYQNKYNESIKNNNAFWKKEGKRITWIKPYKNTFYA